MVRGGGGVWAQRREGTGRQGRMKASSEDRLPKEERYLAPPGAPSCPALAPVVRKPGVRTCEMSTMFLQHSVDFSFQLYAHMLIF